MPERIEGPVLLTLGDDVSTDEILPAGQRVLPFRSNIPRISEFAFCDTNPEYVERAKRVREDGGHWIIGGANYGQGSSREHAAMSPRFLGLQAVIALSFARLHRRNLINTGVQTLEFTDPDDYERVARDDVLALNDLHGQLASAGDGEVTVRNVTGEFSFQARTNYSPRERELLRAGGALAAAPFGGPEAQEAS